MGFARPWRRTLAVLAIAGAGVLQAPREAAACEALGPYLGTGAELPLGCPVFVYTSLMSGSDVERRVTALRGGAYVDVTGTVLQDVVQVLIDRTFLDCDLQVLRADQVQTTFARHALYPQGVSEGERVGVGTGWFGGIQIVAAGTCPAPIAPAPACTSVPPCGGPLPPFIDDTPDDCAAGGGPAGAPVIGAALGLLLYGRARRRRRR